MTTTIITARKIAPTNLETTGTTSMLMPVHADTLFCLLARFVVRSVQFRENWFKCTHCWHDFDTFVPKLAEAGNTNGAPRTETRRLSG
ncbi:hypothetical protein [Gymnodinialimonas ulvae]|uniref:hypothetical protein n=1 Tax=Gymnodinialimonas ulvae TaxID=3126504 RepID=UPI00309D584F